jgi:hypothetical protein
LRFKHSMPLLIATGAARAEMERICPKKCFVLQQSVLFAMKVPDRDWGNNCS